MKTRMQDWLAVSDTEWVHHRTGQRIMMPKLADHDGVPTDEWLSEFERLANINGPGNGQDGRQA